MLDGLSCILAIRRRLPAEDPLTVWVQILLEAGDHTKNAITYAMKTAVFRRI